MKYAATMPAPTAAPAYAGYVPISNYSYTSPSQGLVAQRDVNDGRVRDPQRAAQTLAQLKQVTQAIDTPEKARAAGYHPNPAAPDHWINDDVFRTRNGYDLSRPATIMFEGGKLVGVMLSHNPNRGAPPDLGAGAWHTHFSNDEYAAHVWFNKPLATAFGTEHGDI
jgi:hypothetical protein